MKNSKPIHRGKIPVTCSNSDVSLPIQTRCFPWTATCQKVVGSTIKMTYSTGQKDI